MVPFGTMKASLQGGAAWVSSTHSLSFMFSDQINASCIFLGFFFFFIIYKKIQTFYIMENFLPLPIMADGFPGQYQQVGSFGVSIVGSKQQLMLVQVPGIVFQTWNTISRLFWFLMFSLRNHLLLVGFPSQVTCHVFLSCTFLGLNCQCFKYDMLWRFSFLALSFIVFFCDSCILLDVSSLVWSTVFQNIAEDQIDAIGLGFVLIHSYNQKIWTSYGLLCISFLFVYFLVFCFAGQGFSV